ncbi:collagen alpha-1(I) chain-like [Pseudoliparis swirei]|uniref:collagen alpha-1(I) chain-like n=1 Tax=Pseudoliparis swirei TaxID=2059687 RepID=UPI0024BD5D98|nr:collagen alpha-1(I) chain-like [Pseudoliparis swirei]
MQGKYSPNLRAAPARGRDGPTLFKGPGVKGVKPKPRAGQGPSPGSRGPKAGGPPRGPQGRVTGPFPVSGAGPRGPTGLKGPRVPFGPSQGPGPGGPSSEGVFPHGALTGPVRRPTVRGPSPKPGREVLPRTRPFMGLKRPPGPLARGPLTRGLRAGPLPPGGRGLAHRGPPGPGPATALCPSGLRENGLGGHPFLSPGPQRAPGPGLNLMKGGGRKASGNPG